MPKPLITAEDLYRFRWVSQARLDATGARVAYCVTWGDREARENRSRVVVHPPQSVDGQVEPLGEQHQHSPAWSSRGDLALVDKVAGVQQVFVRPGGDPAAHQLTFLADGAASPRFSPDGRWVAFLGTVVSSPEEVVDDPRRPEPADSGRRPPVVRIARRLDYRHDGAGYADGRNQHLFAVSAAGGEPRQLTAGPWSVEGFDWAPDSRRLAVTGDPEPEADLRLETNIYEIDLDGARRLIAGGMCVVAVAWSPAGDTIAFAAPAGTDGGLLQRIWVVPAPGDQAPRCLTAGLDLGVGDGVVSDMRGGHAVELRWLKERVHFLATGPGRVGVWSVGMDGEAREEVGGARQVFDFDVAPGRLAFCASDPANPGDLHLAEAGGERRLTDLNPWLRERQVAVPENLQLTAPDGLTLEGWLLRPPGFDPGRRHPLVLEVHGGPHAAYGWTFFHEFQILAGAGFLVLGVNPRGSDGYGERFSTAVSLDWGGRDFDDLLACLDQTVARGFVDESRIGIAGGSYGGYMTNWAIGHTDRFAAAVSMRSISNLVSEYAQHDVAIWGRSELGPLTWRDPEELWRRSPIRYVEDIHTPLLLVHGEWDLRCAISQAEELFGALRLLGREVAMARFPGESHDLSRSGRPDRRVERLRLVADWFERHLVASGAAAGRGSTKTA